MAFLSTAGQATKEETEEFYAAMGADKDDFTKKLITAIERVNDKEKAQMIGNLFVNLVRGQFSKEIFVRLTFIIEGIYTDDLLSIKDKGSLLYALKKFEERPEPIFIQPLLTNNLITTARTNPLSSSPIKYELTDLGEVFRKFS